MISFAARTTTTTAYAAVPTYILGRPLDAGATHSCTRTTLQSITSAASMLSSAESFTVIVFLFTTNIDPTISRPLAAWFWKNTSFFLCSHISPMLH